MPAAVARHLERLVIGADYGADGYTTVEQADDLARRLQLRPGAARFSQPAPNTSRSPPQLSTQSSAPTSCVDCVRSSPC
jgi:hypothetical protein